MFWITVILGLPIVLVLVGLSPWLIAGKGRRSLVSAVRNLWLHKLRSFLSVLGIIIGTLAVTSLMAFGEGSMEDALNDIKRQGATNIIVMSVKPPDDATSTRRSFVAKYGLTDEDYDRFRVTIPNLMATLPMRTFSAELRPVTGSRMYNGRVVGTTPRYAVVHKLENMLEAGRFISERDEQPIPANVVVLGSEVARELFPGEDPLGKALKLSGKDRAFVVIGVLKDRLPSTSGADIEKFNSDVYMPLESCRKLLGETQFIRSSGMRGAEQVQLNQIVLTVTDVGDMDEVRDRVRRTASTVRDQLEQYHDRNRKDWDIKVPLDKLEEAERTRDRYRMLLGFIAGISLLVGGIGIMNIMLATVTERTREIGIRRALGAKRTDITMQFLVEAVVQTTLGGLTGVALGFAVIYGLPWVWSMFGSHLPAKVDIASVFMAFFVAVDVGMLFGWYPARRGANLDPIEALRHE
jgi:putative ABC transport system permease protein